MATPTKKAKVEGKIGYIQSVSPLKTSRNNNKYFNATIQTINDFEDIVSFKPESHETFRSMSAAKTPVCLQNTDSIPSLQQKGQFAIKFSSRSKITSPSEAITFPYREKPVEPEDESKTATVVEIKDAGKCHEKVNLSCNIVMVTPTEDVKDLKKMTATAADETGLIEITFWNDQIALISPNRAYKLSQLRVRKYQDEITLTTTMTTTIEEMDPLLHAVEIKDTQQQVQIDTVEISITKNCMNCKNPVVTSESITVKCQNCLKKMLTTKLMEVISIKVTVESKQMILSTDMLKKIKPDYKDMVISDLEDFILINTTVTIFKNHIVDIQLKDKQ